MTLAEVARSLAKLREERARLIVQRRQEGATLRQIASEAGLTHTAVRHILAKEDS